MSSPRTGLARGVSFLLRELIRFPLEGFRRCCGSALTPFRQGRRRDADVDVGRYAQIGQDGETKRRSLRDAGLGNAIRSGTKLSLKSLTSAPMRHHLP